jgi:hypothetical protein
VLHFGFEPPRQPASHPDYIVIGDGGNENKRGPTRQD